MNSLEKEGGSLSVFGGSDKGRDVNSTLNHPSLYQYKWSCLFLVIGPFVSSMQVPPS